VKASFTVLIFLMTGSSLRSGKPYITVDCGSLSKELAPSAFFGHVKGAFTGATEEKAGYFQEAQGGTLFMDEVENLSIETQRMLLRAMEERRYRPVGGQRDRLMDVRIIAATNEDLQEAVAEKRFRKDLLYRFQDFTITVPALHNCLEDILPLADFFREQSCGLLRKEVLDFDEPAKKMLLGYSWPGNVRELKQVIHAAVLICKGKLITPNSLRLQYTGESVSDPMGKEKIDKCLQKDERRNIEQIKTALSISKGNLTQAAALLGISRPTLYKRMSLHGISR
jgi:two-component system response regulator HydG